MFQITVATLISAQVLIMINAFLVGAYYTRFLPGSSRIRFREAQVY